MTQYIEVFEDISIAFDIMAFAKIASQSSLPTKVCVSKVADDNAASSIAAPGIKAT